MDQRKEDLALRYAKAFLNSFPQEFSTENLEKMFEILRFFKEHRKTCYLMQLSLIEKPKKEEILLGLCNRLSLSADYKKIFLLLNKQNRIFLLPAFFRQLVKEYQKRGRYLPVTVQSAAALDDKQKEAVISFMSSKTQMQIIPTYEVCSSLVAGIRVVSTTYLFDHSIQRVLRNIFRVLH